MESNKRRKIDHSCALANENTQGPPAAKPQRTRACAECKNNKVKCFTQPGQTSCTRCLKYEHACVPYNFAQKFMDEDAAWKTEASSDIMQLKAAVELLLRHNNLRDPDGLDLMNAERIVSHPKAMEPQVDGLGPSPGSSTESTNNKRRNFVAEGTSVDVEQDESDLVPLPMNNLYGLTEPENSRLIRVDPAEANGPDFITRGVVSLTEAEFLFNEFREHINPLLWNGLLCSHRTLQDARHSSSLLVATVLTVAALHMPNREDSLHATYNAFVSLMRGTCLLRTQNMDDIRGLCIGAFYLTSLSWALCSRAVRIATEMNLHKSSLQFSRGSLEPYERVRLWYVLYVCDHQFALAYGRPPMMHEDAAIRNADKLLSSGVCSDDDRRLVAQVKLFRILAESYFMHGCDPDLELGDQDFQALRSFNSSIDQWRLRPLHREHSTMLYYYLARFQLNSVSLRGISAKRTLGLEMSWDRQDAANAAITAAESTLRLIAEDPDVRGSLIGMPIFVHAMVAVCASFLLKMAVVFAGSSDESPKGLVLPESLTQYGLHFRTQTAISQVDEVVRMYEHQVADKASQRHVASQVVIGLKELLKRFSLGDDADGSYVYRAAISCRKSLTVSNLLQQNNVSMLDESEYAPATRAGDGNNPDQQIQMEKPTTDSEQQQDPFNLMGDLDWRFNDNFLWGLDISAAVPNARHLSSLV